MRDMRTANEHNRKGEKTHKHCTEDSISKEIFLSNFFFSILKSGTFFLRFQFILIEHFIDIFRTCTEPI